MAIRSSPGVREGTLEKVWGDDPFSGAAIFTGLPGLPKRNPSIGSKNTTISQEEYLRQQRDIIVSVGDYDLIGRGRNAPSRSVPTVYPVSTQRTPPDVPPVAPDREQESLSTPQIDYVIFERPTRPDENFDWGKIQISTGRTPVDLQPPGVPPSMPPGPPVNLPPVCLPPTTLCPPC